MSGPWEKYTQPAPDSAAPVQPAFDVDGARKAGYSDEEIAQHLSQTRNFDYAGAVKAGYSPAEVIQHLSTQGPWQKYQAAAAPEQPAPDTGEAKGVYQNIGEGIKEATDVPGMLDRVGNAISQLVDVAMGRAKSQNNLRHPIDFAKRLISGMAGPSNLSPSEKAARVAGNIAGTVMMGEVAPEATSAAVEAPVAAGEKAAQSFSKGAVTRAMGKDLGASLDRVASDAGLPPSAQSSLSAKAADISSGLKAQAQEIYSALDKASGGRYQRFIDRIEQITDSLTNKYTPPESLGKLKDELSAVKQQYADVQDELVKQGVDPNTIKTADAKWAQGKALEIVSKKFKAGESYSGELKPGTPALDTGLKNLKPNVLERATGSEAANIKRRVVGATKQSARVERNQAIAKGVGKVAGISGGTAGLIKILSGDSK